uniref:Uncharacterized protein n=1 Tax=Oryza nivara TaxID=4536 RepID=A0A0E0HL12_ORYNI
MGFRTCASRQPRLSEKQSRHRRRREESRRRPPVAEAEGNILGINLNLPVDLSLILNYCGKRVPTGFKCF